jgi:MiaB-like tRNA modifying enzyme
MRIYCETYGCTANRADTELMLGQLVAAGFEIVSDPRQAEVILINTCAVKGTTHRKMLHRLRELQDFDGKHVVVAGCLPLIDLSSLEGIGTFAGIISCRSVGEVGEVLRRVLSGERNVRRLESTPCEKPAMPKFRLSAVSAIIPICEGCNSGCSYCSVRFARGRLHSFDQESILEEAERVVKAGYKEILLTAQDTAAYGLDTGTSLPELLNSINSIRGKFRVRVGMMNPRNVKQILPELLEAYRSDKVYKFLHLPVQSGDKEVLGLMRRGYTAGEFLEIVGEFQKHFPDLYLATDIIVGFPGEGEEEFVHTCELIEKVKPDKVNLTRFSPMPGTDASRMPRPDGRAIARRSKYLSALCHEISHEQNKRYVGRIMEGLVIEPGEKGGYVARLPNYKPVVVAEVELGKFISVKITEACPTYLLGVKT